MRYKCMGCKIILKEEDLENDLCPVCGTKPEEMCKSDHLCTCALDIQGGINKCPDCGKLVCACGSHDVAVISRITGYMQDVSGFNAAKYQEVVNDRMHYQI